MPAKKVSGISLQEQYEKDFINFNLNWGSIKGIDNYLCTDNDEKNSQGTCRIRNIRPQSMDCYSECPYYSARDFAKRSQTSLLNYAYWLILFSGTQPSFCISNKFFVHATWSPR